MSKLLERIATALEMLAVPASDRQPCHLRPSDYGADPPHLECDLTLGHTGNHRTKHGGPGCEWWRIVDGRALCASVGEANGESVVCILKGGHFGSHEGLRKTAPGERAWRFTWGGRW